MKTVIFGHLSQGLTTQRFVVKKYIIHGSHVHLQGGKPSSLNKSIRKLVILQDSIHKIEPFGFILADPPYVVRFDL